jgi:ArsR family transcriptional regulator, cadmium/lead-responsive transcriptional repressor
MKRASGGLALPLLGLNAVPGGELSGVLFEGGRLEGDLQSSHVQRLGVQRQDVGFVIHSKTRKAVLAALVRERTPTILARELHTSLPNVSRALRELQARGLVECMNPRARVGRIFTASAKGRKVLGRIGEMEG